MTSASLPEIAQQIKDALAEAKSSATRAVECAAIAGEHLTKAKERLAHGEWLPWLRENFALNRRSAQRYMHMAHVWGDPEKRHAVSQMSLRCALRAFPSEHRCRSRSKPIPAEIATDYACPACAYEWVGKNPKPPASESPLAEVVSLLKKLPAEKFREVEAFVRSLASAQTEEIAA